jgi:hypothetical protein
VIRVREGDVAGDEGPAAADADPGKRDLDTWGKGSGGRQGQSELIESPCQVGIGFLVELTRDDVPPEQGQVSHRGRTRPVS